MADPDPPPLPPPRVSLAYQIAGLAIWAAVILATLAEPPGAQRAARYVAIACR